ncbi:MAG TPA: hypothetical protein VHK24_04520 [Steroidobacter sp.]|jgi:DNA repair exonuclease SbcCD ATPase subunit|nr:hypothetical protein [Steroidobacter sp.]
MKMRWTPTIAAVAFLALASGVVAAQKAQTSGSSAREAFFRCKDARGQFHYGDYMPPPCVGLDTEVLNERGVVVRVIEGQHSRAARLAREELEVKKRQEQEAREQRDRMLIDTYQSVEDIERLRDERLEQLAAQYRVTEQNIANLRERQGRLETQIARFKPYSDGPNAPALPDHIAEEMVHTVNGLRIYEESLASNRKEQADLKISFEAEIRRFKELKGIR